MQLEIKTERGAKAEELRDLFAAHALTALGTWMPPGCSTLIAPDTMTARAMLAYEQADAMLAARAALPHP